MQKISRRMMLRQMGWITSITALSGCSPSLLARSMGDPTGIDRTTTGSISSALRPKIGIDPGIKSAKLMYGELTDGQFIIPAVPYEEMEQRFRRQRLPNSRNIEPGTVLVDTALKHAYYALSREELIRYGVGVGKAGFEWTGEAIVGHKKHWPTWTPPAEMIERQPILAKYSNGMPPGPENPLGARSLYLFQNGRDTLYRLHGTPDWRSIGQSMSSGCIRFLNHDIIDLFGRVNRGSKVLVI